MNIKLTVFFEDPFWVGVFERSHEGTYDASRVVFGSEPKDYDVYDFILKKFDRVKFSSSLSTDENSEIRINPKRLQRKIKREVAASGVGTKAQQAIKLQMEEHKQQHKQLTKTQKEEMERARFELRQQKKKEKKRGH